MRYTQPLQNVIDIFLYKNVLIKKDMLYNIIYINKCYLNRTFYLCIILKVGGRYKLLKVGEYKNWKALCNGVGWNGNNRGTYKEARIKELNNVCKWHKVGHKIIIEEVFGELPQEEDKRKYNKNTGNSTSKYKIVDNLICNTLNGQEQTFTKEQLIKELGLDISNILKGCKINDYSKYDFLAVYTNKVSKMINNSLERLNKNGMIKYYNVVVVDDFADILIIDEDIAAINNIESEVAKEMNIQSVYTLSSKEKKAFYNRCDMKAIELGICQQYYYRAYLLKGIEDTGDYTSNARQDLLIKICKSIRKSITFKNYVMKAKSKFDEQKELMTNTADWGESIYTTLGEEAIYENLNNTICNRLNADYLSEINLIIDYLLEQLKDK